MQSTIARQDRSGPEPEMNALHGRELGYNGVAAAVMFVGCRNEALEVWVI